MTSSSGRLIAFEGGEGAGKSTQAKRLADAIGAVLTREPGGTPLGEQLRALVLGSAHDVVSPRAELMLVLAARAQHLAERIEPLLASGRHVVVDRFSASTVAYQGYGRGLPLGEVRRACEIATAGRTPDLTVLLDLPVAAGAARRSSTPDDRIEGEGAEFHERVRSGYLAESARDPDHWAVVDATAPADEVAAAVLDAVRGRLGLAKETTSP